MPWPRSKMPGGANWPKTAKMGNDTSSGKRKKGLMYRELQIEYARLLTRGRHRCARLWLSHGPS